MTGLSMSIKAHLRKRIRGQSLFVAFLCLVIALAIIPELSQSSNFQYASVSISATSNNIDYAILPVPSRFGENFHGVKASKNDGLNQRATAQIVVLPAYIYFLPNLNSFVNSVGDFYNVWITDLQQAYQLLDLPPPVIFS